MVEGNLRSDDAPLPMAVDSREGNSRRVRYLRPSYGGWLSASSPSPEPDRVRGGPLLATLRPPALRRGRE